MQMARNKFSTRLVQMEALKTKKMECTNGVYIAVDVRSARSAMPYIETTPRWAARSDRWELYFYNAS